MFELDSAGGIRAFRSMLRGLIAMPRRFMDDGRDPDLFDHFAIIAQRINVYTVGDDDVSIIDHRAGRLRVEEGFTHVRARARQGVRHSRERRLNDPRLRENFVECIFAYRRLRALFATRWSMGTVGRFHTAHKLTLMATCPRLQPHPVELILRNHV